MAAVAYPAPDEMQLFCRFCKKTLPALLERSIADSGRTVNESSTFEYICSKCHRAQCYFGRDIVQGVKNEEGITNIPEMEVRKYSIKETFRVGEIISHPSHEADGVIVGKEPGNPSKIVVRFGTDKLVNKFVEGIE